MSSSRSYSNISNVLATIFEDRVAEQLNRAAVFMKWAQKKDSISRNINIPVRDHDAQVASSAIYLAPGTDVLQFNSDNFDNAHLEHATVSEAFSIDNLALHAAAATGNPAALEDLLGNEFLTASNRLISNLNKECYVGDGGVVSSAQTIQGLVGDGYVGSSGWLATGNTVAGIDRSSVTKWNSNVLLNGGTARDISFQLLEDADRQVYIASGMAVQAWFMDPIQWDKLALAFVNVSEQHINPMQRGQVAYTVGSTTMSYKGVPIFRDKDCPAGTALGLNGETMSFQQLPFTSGVLSSLDHGMMELQPTPEAQFGDGPVPVRVRVQELSRAGDYTRFQLVLYPQLVVRRPNANVIIGDLHSSY